MPAIEFSKHAKDMLQERNILEEWVWRTISDPDEKRRGDDDNIHYAKSIEEHGRRVLHIVVNQDAQPNRIVTVFFDRRLGRKARRTR